MQLHDINQGALDHASRALQLMLNSLPICPYSLARHADPLGAHFGTEHNGEAVPEIPFSAKIVRRAKDHVDREAIEIAESETVPPIH